MDEENEKQGVLGTVAALGKLLVSSKIQQCAARNVVSPASLINLAYDNSREREGLGLPNLNFEVGT